MACRLLGVKPLPDSVLAYCQFSEIYIEIQIFVLENAFETVVSEKAAI